MHRRELLKIMGLSALAFVPCMPIAVRAEPTTLATASAALVVVKAAVSVVNAISKDGPSVVDILDVQSQILVQISKQISEVMSSLELVTKDLEKIQEMIGDLPTEVVDELSKRQIQSFLRQYDELLVSYRVDKKKVGGAAARKNISEEMKGLLIEGIRKSRSVLMTSQNSINVPFVASALNVETDAMLMAGIRESRIEGAHTTYEKWFSDVINDPNYGLNKQIEDLRTQIAHEKSQMLGYRGVDICYLENSIRNIGGMELMVKFDFDHAKLATHFKLPQHVTAELATEVSKLRDLSVIEDRDIPFSLNDMSSVITDVEQASWAYGYFPRELNNILADKKPLESWPPTVPDCNKRSKNISSALNAHIKSIEPKFYRLIALLSNRYAANMAIQSIHEFRSKM